MASVRIRTGSKFWYACITLPTGKQRQFSTGLEDREEVLAAATAAERAARRHDAAPHQLRAALDRIAEDFVPKDDINPGPWLRAWAKSRKNEVAATSFSTYTSLMDEVAGWLAWREVRSFAALTTARITELRDWWAERNSPRTANNKLKILRAALNAAVAERRSENNPAARIPVLKAQKTARREFREAEIDILLPTLTGEWRAIFLLGLYTGQRLNDLAVLRWRNVDVAGKSIAFTAQKTGALVALPLMQPVIDALLTLPAGEDPDALLLPEIAKLSPGARSNQFRSLLAAVGLAPKVPKRRGRGQAKRTHRETQPLSFHSLRHTATSRLKAAGVSDAIARAVIGHESAAVSRQYTHLDMETLRKALEKMPSL